MLMDTIEDEAQRLYARLAEWFGDVHEQARNGAFDGAELAGNAQAIRVRPERLEALFGETFKEHPSSSYLDLKSVNVGIYAARLGLILGYDTPALDRLCSAALLHKIGMARLPQELLVKTGTLTPRDRELIREHPRLGHDLILESLGDEARGVAEIVIQAHERLDGSGYPAGLSGGQIVEEALIVGLVDSYEAMIQPRPYRERLIPFAAVKELLERERNRFPRELLRQFVSSFSVFPPFSYVRLNSNAIAQVIETEAGHPLRPTVRIVLDANGRKPAADQVVRLREAPLLYVTEPVDQENVRR